MSEEAKNENKYAEPVAVDIEAYLASLPEPAGPEVVGLGTTDTIYLSQMIYKNNMARRSLSVYHLQRNLIGRGYTDAEKDKSGWFGDNTMTALSNFQRQNALPATGLADAETLTRLFADDPNVTLVL